MPSLAPSVVKNPTLPAPPGEFLVPRILIVDDSEDDAFLVAHELGRVMRDAQFRRVDRADDMADALKSEDWDVVICDHSMPRFDSLSALSVLKSSGKDIPFVIYSGRLEPETGISAMSGGASDFVPKSSPGHLIAVVRRELAHSRERRARALAEQSARQLATCDSLTRLPNRRGFVDLVAARLDASSPTGAMFYIDLDRFMRINDSFGYAVGDSLIAQVAVRLRTIVSERDVLARLGQDEFALFAPELASGQQARTLGKRIMQCFGTAFAQNGQDLYLTPSVGVSLCPENGSDPEALLKSAESAMFEAKKLGRNNFQLYRSELSNGSMRRLRLESDLRHAAARNEFFLAYQPILELRSGLIVATEALVRWRHPELGLVPPDEFIGLADESGAIIEIGDWVLRTACAQTVAWHRLGYSHLAVAVNFSAAQFRSEDLAERIGQVLAETGLSGEALDIEITETVAMEKAESTIETLRKLKRMGVRISIDDFGTGYSSLAYLKRFPIDILKIDKSFVRDIHADSDDAAIVRTVTALGRSLKLQVLAEGVETDAQFKFLKTEGCDRMQGYLFSKPLDPDSMLALLERHTPRPTPVHRPIGAGARVS